MLTTGFAENLHTAQLITPTKPTSLEATGVAADTLASMDRIHKIVSNLKATLIIQHEISDVGKLPAFPASSG